MYRYCGSRYVYYACSIDNPEATHSAQSESTGLRAQHIKRVPTVSRLTWRRQFFQSGKTLAIERGKGLNQPVMRVAAQRVAQGDWLHVFPEGRVGYGGTMGPFKWGIGKIVCDSIQSGQR